jgi:hypothetical protein
MHPTPPTTHRSRPPQPLPVGSGGLPVSADRDPRHAQLSDVGIVPEQFFGSRASLGMACPEAALMRAVLENALTCFQRQFMTAGRRVQRESQEAEEWILSDDSHWLFSFVSVCLVLGLEPESVRQQLKRWSHSHPNTPERKRNRVSAERQPPKLAA